MFQRIHRKNMFQRIYKKILQYQTICSSICFQNIQELLKFFTYLAGTVPYSPVISFFHIREIASLPYMAK